MSENKFITDEELKKYGTTWSLSARARALVNQQKASWQNAGDHYRSLRKVQTREISFGHFRILLQFNPGRIRSSAANTSTAAIDARPCFLCAANLPEEQKGIPYPGGFVILANPFPIFNVHLTIPSLSHTPQLLEGRIGDLLRLTRDLREFTLFYNGPQCGASAPDHFHFQAGIRDTLPVEEELAGLLQHHATILRNDGTLLMAAVVGYLRQFLLLRSGDERLLEDMLSRAIALLPENGGEEPMLNLLAWFQEGEWNLLIFPRALQRPWQYFADEGEKIVVSPAAVELGGVVVLPREEDFHKVTAADLGSVFSQVSLSTEEFRKWTDKLTAFSLP